MIAYFAYGSNMSQEDLDRFCRERCNGSFPARMPGVAELKRAFMEPTREYMDIIIAAAEAHRFPAWYLDRLRTIRVSGSRG